MVQLATASVNYRKRPLTWFRCNRQRGRSLQPRILWDSALSVRLFGAPVGRENGPNGVSGKLVVSVPSEGPLSPNDRTSKMLD
jgi:hypothetical protein